jgi:hypothetical protein
MAAALLVGVGTLPALCKPVPPSGMTADAFDDNIAFAPADDAEAAKPPLEVHEIEESQVTAAGGKLVVAGRNWLDADDVERNDILNLVAEAQPEDTILVIVVATGDIWQIPLADGLPAGVRPWTGDEYNALDEYADGRYDDGPLTRPEFEQITGVAKVGTIAQLLYVHNFGPIGYREITSRQGFQVALAATWLRETPVQRTLRLIMLQRVLQRLPQFQGEGNRLAFGLMVPGGSLYAMPELAYLNMVGQRALRAWMVYEITGLPVALLLLDRAIKNTRLVVDRVAAEP